MNKNLVISTVGEKSLHRNWIQGTNYDTCLIYYGDKDGYETQSTYYKKQKGYKYHLIQDILNDNPSFFDYEYIWLPDDDIACSSNDIDKLFETMKFYNLELAQPSIIGYYGIDITLNQKGSVIRYTNWVEIMCPCFSSAALKLCEHTFKENNCGWSIETIWTDILNHPMDKIAIIDDIIVTHTRPVLTGDTYKSSSHPLDLALRESRKVYDKWQLYEKMKKDLKKGTPVLGEAFGLVIYSQIMKPMEKGIAKQNRLWPNTELMNRAIKEFC